MKKESWFKDFYNTLLEVGKVLNKKDNKGKFLIIKDLLILILVICLLKIPFVFVRDIFDSIFSNFMNDFISILIGIGLEILYVIFALVFFKRTLKRYIERENK